MLIVLLAFLSLHSLLLSYWRGQPFLLQSTLADETSQKRKVTGKSSPTSAKRQRLHPATSSTSITGRTLPASSSQQQSTSDAGDTTVQTSRRLRMFEFDGYGEKGDGKERQLWEPKDLPDVSSQEDERSEADITAVSDDSDSGEPQMNNSTARNSSGKPESNKKGKAGSGHAGKAVPKKSSSTFLDKFSLPSASSSPAIGKKSQVKYTPLEQQYVAIKEQYADAVLLVECGYKYRFFGHDAEVSETVFCNQGDTQVVNCIHFATFSCCQSRLMKRMYLWWNLCTLYLLACQVRVTVDDSGLCCL